VALFSIFKNMPLLGGERFDGGTGLTVAHGQMQAMAGNATWLGELSPVHAGAARVVPETILWIFHLDGHCAAVAGEYATYMAGRIVTRPPVMALYAPFPHVNASTPARERDVFFSKSSARRTSPSVT
jgi:hypothetical protein